MRDYVGYTDKHAIEQIAKVERKDDCYRWVVSLGGFTEDVTQHADGLSVNLMNGTQLVDWLAERWQDFSSTTKQKLGIAAVPPLIC